MQNRAPLIVDYYTDVLCVWAWIARHRIDELEKEQGDKIQVRHHCIDVFGDTQSRIGKGWSDRGGFAGFGEHVRESAAPYEFAPTNAAIWNKVRPLTSATAHLILKAVELLASPGDAKQFADTLRECFFVDALDISETGVVLGIAHDSGYDRDELSRIIDSGQAIASLMADYKSANDLRLKGSPSVILNDGRQVLYGNVGYRILSANIEELLHSPVSEASWC